MWKCHKCEKPVYFAERKQSVGYNWHPECLRCEECGKRLNPGQHAEHKGVPYCHVPCYGALFGPQLFGHGTRVESHKSFGQQHNGQKTGNATISGLERTHLESRLKLYNQYFDGRSGEIRSREVNGRLILEGSLRIYWGVQGVIHLKENDDQRTVVTVRKRNSYRLSQASYQNSDDEQNTISLDDSSSTISSTEISPDHHTSISCDVKLANGNPTKSDEIATASINNSGSYSSRKSITLPTKLDLTQMQRDELDELLVIERQVEEHSKLYQTMPEALPSSKQHQNHNSVEDSLKSSTTPTVLDNNIEISEKSDRDDVVPGPNQLNRSMSGPDCLERRFEAPSPEFDNSMSTDSGDISTMSDMPQDAVVLRPSKTGPAAIRRRPGKRLSRSKVKRRCSINGHFYDRETSFFTPPHGSQTSVWVTSLVNTQEVINLMLEKYKVESDASKFALFIVRDNGEQRRIKDEEYPLVARVLLGPHEDVAKLFLMDRQSTREVSSEVAQFLNLSLAECRAILNQYYSQEEREAERIKQKYGETQKRILMQIEELKALA